MRRNSDIEKIQASYLFTEIAQRRDALKKAQPEAKIISLGIGDTTEPIPQVIVEAMRAAVDALATHEGYTGYQAAYGRQDLREAIARVIYKGRVSADEVFISDGSKPDIGRLQLLFGRNAKMAVQDPSYPAYVASGVISGKSRAVNTATGQYCGIRYMACTPENGFFPNLADLQETDVIYFCSPNNPTGVVPTRAQVEELVDYAHAHKCIIVFDTAYAAYIRDDGLIRSIFEVEGARQVAMETGSFSKVVGFTGVRLGWTVFPKELQFDDGSAVIDDWKQIMSTYFNGACNISQAGGVAALSDAGLEASSELISYYLENTRILREALLSMGLSCYGGEHAPYIWARTSGRGSWELFDEILQKAHIVTTPGAGFGPAGEGFIRFSAFGQRTDIQEACTRLRAVFGADATCVELCQSRS